MAEARKTVKAVKVDTDVVELTLTIDEANFLANLMSGVGGDPVNSPRRFAASIGNALYGAGFNWVALEDEYEHTGCVTYH